MPKKPYRSPPDSNAPFMGLFDRLLTPGRKGRAKLPGEKTQYERHSLALTVEQWAALDELARLLNTRSRGGPRHGQPSWRTMIAMLAEQSDDIIRAWQQEDMAQ